MLCDPNPTNIPFTISFQKFFSYEYIFIIQLNQPILAVLDLSQKWNIEGLDDDGEIILTAALLGMEVIAFKDLDYFLAEGFVARG